MLVRPFFRFSASTPPPLLLFCVRAQDNAESEKNGTVLSTLRIISEFLFFSAPVSRPAARGRTGITAAPHNLVLAALGTPRIDRIRIAVIPVPVGTPFLDVLLHVFFWGGRESIPFPCAWTGLAGVNIDMQTTAAVMNNKAVFDFITEPPV